MYYWREFLLWFCGFMIWLISVAFLVRSLARCSGLRISYCCSWSVGHRCSLALIPGLGTSICLKGSQEEKENKYIEVPFSFSMVHSYWVSSMCRTLRYKRYIQYRCLTSGSLNVPVWWRGWVWASALKRAWEIVLVRNGRRHMAPGASRPLHVAIFVKGLCGV